MANEPDTTTLLLPMVNEGNAIPIQQNPSSDQLSADLNDLNRKSQAFAVAVSQEKKSEATGAILLLPNDSLIEQAEGILRLYNAQTSDEREVEQLKRSMAAHLIRMGRMYFDAIYAPWVKTALPTDALSCGEAAQRACRCYESAFQMAREPLAALMLAEIYRIAGFFATAKHWLEEARREASASNDVGKMDQIRLASVSLKAGGQLSDTPLSHKDVFPTKHSAGLMLNLQPLHLTPTGILETPVPEIDSGALDPSAPLNSTGRISGGQSTSFQRPAVIQGLILFLIVLVAAAGATLFVQHFSLRDRYHGYTPSFSTVATTSSAPISQGTTSNKAVSYSGDFDFNSRPVSDSDLVGKTAYELDLMRNEPYARHGYKFLRTDMAGYFLKKLWYHPTQGDQDQVWKDFSPLERRNVVFVRDYERQHGMVRQIGSVGTAGALATESTAYWLVVLGSYPVAERAKCEERLRTVQSHGFSARIINTNDYPTLKYGLLAVVSGPFSKETALTEKNRARETVSDAYIRNTK